MLIEKMNSSFNMEDVDGFKIPQPIKNRPSHFKNKDVTLKFFSKLPCIKTCMTKFNFSDEKNKSSYKKIGFESLQDDFDQLSKSQHSTAACQHICDAQKLCPELMPSNCEDYFEKKCSCTVYCKKTLRFIQKFVKDENQFAEIEDLCQIRDQI